jgi:hypothetical protein
MAYSGSGIVRRTLDAGNRETNSRKDVQHQRGKQVGAWRRIGGGQGALSQARKETGVACRPSKQPDYSGLARESNVVRLMSKSGNREVETDPALKARPDPNYQKRPQQ